MYDVANSSFTTVIITVYFSVVFPRIVVGDAPDFRLGNLLWSSILAASYLMAVFALPLVGVWTDLRGRRLSMLAGCTALTSVATAQLYFAGPGMIGWAAVAVVAANVGFSVGESVVASLLPRLGPANRLGRISGMAWGLGYFGGLGSTALVLAVAGPADGSSELYRWAGPITAVWFAFASLPTFVLLRRHNGGFAKDERPSIATVASVAVNRVRSALALAKSQPALWQVLASTFHAMAGLSIVISFAFIYGDQVIGWDHRGQATMFVITQITAAAGAAAFGALQSRVGDLPVYKTTLWIWLLVVLALPSADLLRVAMRLTLGIDASLQTVFLCIGGVAGWCLGATQSASRTLVALLADDQRNGEAFAFWGMAGKLAAVVGLLSIGTLQWAFGLKHGVLATALFFALALVCLRGLTLRPMGR